MAHFVLDNSLSLGVDVYVCVAGGGGGRWSLCIVRC